MRIIQFVSCFILLNVYSMIALASDMGKRPNLIVIVVDDQRWDELSIAGHPYLKTPNIDRLAREGAMFTSAYTVSPLCSPNRASILTGQYISRHGIVDNIARNAASHALDLFAIDLQASGYDTAHIGKWHMGNDPTPRPGYTYWVSFPGQGRSTDPEIYEGGRLHKVKGYITDILTERAVSFIQQDRDKPFFLYIGHKAVHPDVIQNDDGSVNVEHGAKFTAAARHRGEYKDQVFPRRKNADSVNMNQSDKPVLKKILKAKTSDEVVKSMGAMLDPGTSEQTIRDRAEMMIAVDEGVGALLQTLEALGVLDNTLVLYTSDNGYFYGEHGLSVERRLPYEESIRVPLIIRYPVSIDAGTKIDQFAISIDIAPTMLALANVPIPQHVQGKSLLPLFKKNIAEWRDAFLVEYVSYEKPMPWLLNTGYKAIRRGNYKYIHWLYHEGSDELYNLEQDPYELKNLISESDMGKTVNKLRHELAELIVYSQGLN